MQPGKQNASALTGRVACYFCGSRSAKTIYRDVYTMCTIARCDVCGSYYTRDRYLEEEIRHRYEQDAYYAQRCVASWYDEWLPSHHNELFFIEKYCSEKARLLDVGCGGGGFVYVARQRGWHAYGIDISEEAIRRARGKWQLDSVVQADFEQYTFGTCFDVVTAFHVLEHVYRPREFLRRVGQVLAPGGLFVVAVPNFGSIDVRFNPRIRQSVTDLPYHVIHFTPSTLRVLLKSSGFRVVGRRFDLSRIVETPLQAALRLFRHEGLIVAAQRRSEVGAKAPSTALSLANEQSRAKQVILQALAWLCPGTYMVYYARKREQH